MAGLRMEVHGVPPQVLLLLSVGLEGVQNLGSVDNLPATEPADVRNVQMVSLSCTTPGCYSGAFFFINILPKKVDMDNSF